ncbi:MAG: hypothetical protein LBD03_08170 [Methanobrevibacter sp.]|jgi:IS5 family transposase|nr:hypothetical protein [Candidatus Methanovirga procula]
MNIDQIVDWEIFRSILMQAYKNKTRKGGRPEIDVIVMFKTLIIQKMYNLYWVPEIRNKPL